MSQFAWETKKKTPTQTQPPKTTQKQRNPQKTPKQNTKEKTQQHIFTFSNIVSFKIRKIYILKTRKNRSSTCIPLNTLSVHITWNGIESKILCHSVNSLQLRRERHLLIAQYDTVQHNVDFFSLSNFQYFSSAQHLPKKAKHDLKNTPKT